MIRALLAAGALVACTPAGLPLSPAHPASPDAPTGRLAGPPSALRPGVATPDTPAPPAAPAPADEHAGHH